MEHIPLYIRRVLGSLTILLLAGRQLPAQPPNSDPVRRWSATALLDRYEREQRARTVPSYGSQFISIALTRAETPSSRRDSLLDGLEKFATSSTSVELRRAATYKIASFGRDGWSGPPLPGIMARLARIYRSQPDAGVRLGIRDAMPEQAERRAAAAFLRTLATEPDPTNDGTGPHGYFSVGDPRVEALSRLSEMGDEGRAVLQAMHRSGEARSPQARAVLAEMAQRGFPVRDIRRREP